LGNRKHNKCFLKILGALTLVSEIRYQIVFMKHTQKFIVFYHSNLFRHQRAEGDYEGDTFCVYLNTVPSQISSNQSPIKMAIWKTFNDVEVSKWRVNTKKSNKGRQVASCNFIKMSSRMFCSYWFGHLCVQLL